MILNQEYKTTNDSYSVSENENWNNFKKQLENTYLKHDTCYYPGIIHLGINHMEDLHKYIKKHVWMFKVSLLVVNYGNNQIVCQY